MNITHFREFIIFPIWLILFNYVHAVTANCAAYNDCGTDVGVCRIHALKENCQNLWLLGLVSDETRSSLPSAPVQLHCELLKANATTYISVRWKRPWKIGSDNVDKKKI